MIRPAFLITIDTEGDHLWSRPAIVTTRNARFLPRFQSLCERFGLKPSWLTNWEMANDDAYVEFATDAVARGAAEVGMHLHAWDTPPLVGLTPDDTRYHPYLIEHPEPVMREKIGRMTDLLGSRFKLQPRSHRAGRWALDERYARLLADAGYRVDCSVTPLISWSSHGGAPGGSGGSDYRHFPAAAYWMDLDHIARPGRSPLLEVPMTIAMQGSAVLEPLRPVLSRLPLVRRLLPQPRWLRPRGGNLRSMEGMLSETAPGTGSYVQFMLHSSELMPGGSPTFPDAGSIERLYDDLEALFALAATRFDGLTLTQFRERVTAGSVATSA